MAFFNLLSLEFQAITSKLAFDQEIIVVIIQKPFFFQSPSAVIMVFVRPPSH